MYLIFLFLFVFSFFLDIITKTFATQINGSITVIDNFFALTYVENKGAAWGLGSGHQWFFILVGLIFAVVLVGCILHLNLKYKSLFYSISFLLAGTLGNCMDRIFNGYVIDFLDFTIFGYNFTVFNIADIYIVCSTFVILINILLIKEEDVFVKRKIFVKND